MEKMIRFAEEDKTLYLPFFNTLKQVKILGYSMDFTTGTETISLQMPEGTNPAIYNADIKDVKLFYDEATECKVRTYIEEFNTINALRTDGKVFRFQGLKPEEDDLCPTFRGYLMQGADVQEIEFYLKRVVMNRETFIEYTFNQDITADIWPSAELAKAYSAYRIDNQDGSTGNYIGYMRKTMLSERQKAAVTMLHNAYKTLNEEGVRICFDNVNSRLYFYNQEATLETTHDRENNAQYADLDLDWLDESMSFEADIWTCGEETFIKVS